MHFGKPLSILYYSTEFHEVETVFVFGANSKLKDIYRLVLRKPPVWDNYTVKKGFRFSRPQPECHLPDSPLAGIIKLFSARESLW